jgi:hypothetical protein
LEHASTTHGARIAEHRQWQEAARAKLDAWHNDVLRTLAEQRRHAEAVGNVASAAHERINALSDGTEREIDRLSERVRALKEVADSWDSDTEWMDATDERLRGVDIRHQHYVDMTNKRLADLERTVDALRLLAGATPDAGPCAALGGHNVDPATWRCVRPGCRPATFEASLPDGRTVALPTGPAPGSAPRSQPQDADPNRAVRNRSSVAGAVRYVTALLRDYERNAPHHPGTAARMVLDLRRVRDLLEGVDL